MINKLNEILYTKKFLSIGNIIVFAQKNGSAHLGIINKYNNKKWFFIHTYINLGMVIESYFDEYWEKN